MAQLHWISAAGLDGPGDTGLMLCDRCKSPGDDHPAACLGLPCRDAQVLCADRDQAHTWAAGTGCSVGWTGPLDRLNRELRQTEQLARRLRNMLPRSSAPVENPGGSTLTVWGLSSAPAALDVWRSGLWFDVPTVRVVVGQTPHNRDAWDAVLAEPRCEVWCASPERLVPARPGVAAMASIRAIPQPPCSFIRRPGIDITALPPVIAVTCDNAPSTTTASRPTNRTRSRHALELSGFAGSAGAGALSAIWAGAILRQVHRDLTIALVGVGPGVDRALAFARQLYEPQLVRSVGTSAAALSEANLRAWVCLSDDPQHTLSARFAMALGVQPVLLEAIAPLAGVTHAVNGVCVPSLDPLILADRLNRLISQKTPAASAGTTH